MYGEAARIYLARIGAGESDASTLLRQMRLAEIDRRIQRVTLPSGNDLYEADHAGLDQVSPSGVSVHKNKTDFIATPHDHSYKLLFSQQVLVKDLLRGFVPQDWVGQLDFDTLEKVSTEYISHELLRRSNDLVWRLRLNGDRWLYVYVMLEFQSSNDRWMALRLMTYTGLLYQDLVRNHQLTVDGKLPPVFPIVIHNGLSPWCSPLNLSELIEQVPGHLSDYTPKMKYFLLDESAQLTDGPRQRDNFAADLIDLECSRSSEQALKIVKRLASRLRQIEHRPLAEAFKAWIQAVLVKRLFPAENIPKFDSFEEVTTVLEERVDQWREDIQRDARREGLQQGLEEGRQQGIQQGIEQGIERGIEQGIERGIERGIEKGIEQGIRKAQIDLLGRQAEERFGPLTATHREQLAQFDQRQFDALCSRIFTARSLDELFQLA